MSDEKDTSEDNQAENPEQLRAEQQEKMKKKLEDMGVMRDNHSASDEHPEPVKQPSSLMKSGLTVVFAVIVAGVFWWWYSSGEHTTTVADNGSSQATLPYSLPGGPPPGNYPPAPYPYGAPLPPPPMHPAVEGNVDQPARDAVTNGPPDLRGYPGNRGDDRFGPPPGWGAYGPGPAPGYYGPPPPPAYYGRPYNGPPSGWSPYGPPPMPGYYGPPPPGYMGYMPGY